MCYMTSVGIRQLRQNASALLRLVAAGETIEITDHGHPVARIVPLHNQRALDLAHIQYRVGKIDLRVVEQRQLALYGALTSRLQVQSEQLAQRVNLHLALGGSFEPADKAAAR